MNREKLFAHIVGLTLLLLLPLTAMAAAVPTVTQSIGLNPGWNAVYLEVTPASASPAEVFKDLPSGSSVWAWTGKDETVQFIQDPSEPPMNLPKWLAIFTAAADAPLNNLYAITANSAYLIQLPAGSAPLTLNVTGRPTMRHKGWVPDSFNLTGFGLSDAPPTFASFFAPSNSHRNQAIYRLNNLTGAWEIVNNPATTAMRSGEAFWIYCQSGSDYQGPLTVEADGVDGLDFGAGISILKLTVKNATGSNRAISVSQLSAVNPVALAWRNFDAAGGNILSTPISAMQPITVTAAGSVTLTIAAQRGSFSGDAASVLEFGDGQGYRVRVPVTAASKPVSGYPGLWSGIATLTKVSQLADAGPAPGFASGAAKATPAELNLKLIMHQDSFGQVRLLKQAIIMYKEGTTPGSGRNVVLTNDSLIPSYSGVTQRDGTKVGRRLSAIGIDYSPNSDTSFGTDFDGTALKCSGTISSTIECRAVLESSAPYTSPTNPFLHKYHPDHDNLSGDFKTYKQEANRIERTITLAFDNTPAANPANPPLGWGTSVLGGTYSEVIKGLAKGPITVGGNFTLQLATNVAQLNE